MSGAKKNTDAEIVLRYFFKKLCSEQVWNKRTSKMKHILFIIFGNKHCSGWPRHRENREFGSYFFQTGKTQGILF